MNLDEAARRGGVASQPASVDPLLDGDMGLRLQLEIAAARIGAVIVLERALDIDGMGVVAFDEVAVIAVHRPYQISEGRKHAVWQAPSESRRPGG